MKCVYFSLFMDEPLARNATGNEWHQQIVNLTTQSTKSKRNVKEREIVVSLLQMSSLVKIRVLGTSNTSKFGGTASKRPQTDVIWWKLFLTYMLKLCWIYFQMDTKLFMKTEFSCFDCYIDAWYQFYLCWGYKEFSLNVSKFSSLSKFI